MSNRVHIICHPQAGGGKGEQVLNEVKQELDSFNLEHLTFLTNYSTHAEILTEQLIQKWHKANFDYLIVIGGDGTLHEVVQTLIKHQSQIPICYISAGTGNDFSRNWQAGLTVRQILEKMLYSRSPRKIPIIAYTNITTGRHGVIVNNLGFGVDAEANFQAQNILAKPTINKFKMRNAAYLFGLLKSLSKIKHFKVTGEMDSHHFHFDDVSIAAILNSPTLGGGINIDQLTKAENEEISLVLYHDVTFPSIFDLITKVLITKNTNQAKNISRYTGQRLIINIEDNIRGHVDGEVLPEKAVSLDCTLTQYPFYL